MNKLPQYLMLIFLLFCSSIAAAQSDSKSQNIQVVNGKRYYLHKVAKGQSIYAISKIYNTDLNAIFSENPDAIDGITTGQELKIPVKEEGAGTQQAGATKLQTHKVIKGETRFGICKKYKITEAKLEELNPLIKQGIKEGMELRVPVGMEETKPALAHTTTTNNTAVEKKDSTQNYHITEAKETLYGIAKKHNTTVEALTKLNPELANGLKPGQKIKIKELPQSAPATIGHVTVTGAAVSVPKEENSLTPPTEGWEGWEQKPAKQVYHVGVFLPLNLNAVDLINPEQMALDKLPFPLSQQISVDFYEGMLVALDSVISPDFKVVYEIFDADEKDSSRIEKLCKEERFKKLDLIVGPLHISAFKTVEVYAKKQQTPIVSPVAQQNKILFNTPNSSKTTPSNNTLQEGLAEFVADSFRMNNVVIINSGRAKEQQNVKMFKARYNEYLSRKYNNTKDTLNEVRGLAGAKGAYNAHKKNYYVLLTEDEVFLTDFLTQLHVYADKKDIHLIGMKKLIYSDHIDPEYLNHFQFTYATPMYIDYSLEGVRKIAAKYKDKYYTDPAEFYFEGYDIALYYLKTLKKEGPMFFQNLDKLSAKGLVMNFSFFRPSGTTGYDNKSIQVIRYRDYKFQKIN